MKNLIRAVAVSIALLVTANSFAQFRITISPPALRMEIIPDRPFDNAVWQPGYWQFDAVSGSFIWVSGRWAVAPYSSAVWIAPHYRFYDGEFHFIEGHWKRMQ